MRRIERGEVGSGVEGKTYLGLLLEALPGQGKDLVLSGCEIAFVDHGDGVDVDVDDFGVVLCMGTSRQMFESLPKV
jgi:hypothetical protein